MWSQNGDRFCEAVRRPSPWSHDGGLISKWVSSNTCAKTHKLQSHFTLDKCYNTQNREKKVLWKNNLTFSLRIAINKNQTRLNFNPTHCYGLDSFVHRKYQLYKNSHDFYEDLKRRREKTKAVSWWNQCLRSLTAPSLILPRALHKSKIFDEIHNGQHDASCVWRRCRQKLSIQAMKLSVNFKLDKNHFFTLQIKYQNRNELYHVKQCFGGEWSVGAPNVLELRTVV